MTETALSFAKRRRRPTVLVVEDEVLLRMGLAHAMRAVGLRVFEASHAGEALDIIHAGLVPDVLFTDVRVPGPIDGLRLAALLEATFPELRIVISSAYITSADLKVSFKFIDKPTAPEEVAREVLKLAT